MTLIVSPLSQVHHVLSMHKPSHVLTLMAPDGAAPACVSVPPDCRLILAFNDVVSATPGLVVPSREMIQQILDFGARWTREAPMLVHCLAGISRSTAAAYSLACASTAPGRELELAQRLRSASPTATPNLLMVALADNLLGRDGAMLEAVKSIGRGANAYEGAPFTFAF